MRVDNVEVEAKDFKEDLFVGENQLLPSFHLLEDTS